MRKASFYFCGAVLSVSALILGAGCSSNGNGTTTEGSGGSTSSTSSSEPTTSTSSSEPTTTSSTSSGSGTAATCDSYCTDIMANCTGDLQQYATADDCKATCKDIPASDQGTVGATSGATLECHAYHAGAPAKMDAAKHCPHAGPTGGDIKVSDTAEGACGDGCALFCDIAMTACSAQKTYATKDACTADCRTFKDTTNTAGYTWTYYNQAANWKNDFACRMYHVTAAVGDPAKHCPHITGASMACTK